MTLQNEAWDGDTANHPVIHCNRLEDGLMPRRETTIRKPPRSFPPASYSGAQIRVPVRVDDAVALEQGELFPYDPPAVMVGERRIIVGVCGFKGHGKDTAAMILQQKYGFTRLSFADGVKKVVSEILHVPLWWLHDPVKKEEMHEPSGKTLRLWMQLIGTEVGRSVWSNAWVNWWKGEVEALDLHRVVVTDMRFFNEFNAITEGEWDAMTMRIMNPIRGVPDDAHESERYALQLPVNTEVINDGSINQLWERTEAKLLKRFPQLWTH